MATASSSTESSLLPSVSAARKCSAALTNSSSSTGSGSGIGSGTISGTDSGIGSSICSGSGVGSGRTGGSSLPNPRSKAPENAFSSARATMRSLLVSRIGSTAATGSTDGNSTVPETSDGEGRSGSDTSFSTLGVGGSGTSSAGRGVWTAGVGTERGTEAIGAAAALPLANEGTGKACPATSNDALSSSATARSVAVWDAGSANNCLSVLR